MTALQQVADNDGDGVLSLREHLQYANYSSGFTLTDVRSTKAFINYFYRYANDNDYGGGLRSYG